MNGVIKFGKKDKPNPRFIDPFEGIQRIEEVAYELTMPQDLSSFHPIFNILMLKNNMVMIVYDSMELGTVRPNIWDLRKNLQLFSIVRLEI